MRETLIDWALETKFSVSCYRNFEIVFYDKSKFIKPMKINILRTNNASTSGATNRSIKEEGSEAKLQ
jgi:hypothetical protein